MRFTVWRKTGFNLSFEYDVPAGTKSAVGAVGTGAGTGADVGAGADAIAGDSSFSIPSIVESKK